VDFANRHFTDGYAVIYKRQGVDPNQKKIEKPAITPIAANRDTVSQFVKDIQAAEVKPIEPKFVNFERDITMGRAADRLPYAYVQNKENDIKNPSKETVDALTHLDLPSGVDINIKL
jgi:hypothetical protein